MKKLVLIAAGLFVLHTIEESVSFFWNTDPLTNIAAHALHIPAFWLYWTGQVLLYTFLIILLSTHNAAIRKWGSIVLGIVLLLEMEHIAIGLYVGYPIGLVTGVILSAYGVFYSTMLANKYLENIKIPINADIKRDAITLTFLLAILYLLGFTTSLAPKNASNTSALRNADTVLANASTTDYMLYNEVVAEVLPKEGFQTKIVLGDVVPSLVTDGIIDMSKMTALYKNNGGIPADEMKILTQPSNTPLAVNAENASRLVNLLWPIGLSNKMAINDSSPIAGKNVNNFASTGGWSLGKQDSGGAYFNAYPLVPLTPQQEARVQQIAGSTYRPCCDNSTFFQDCNHGSAALALIELGVVQGLPDADIYKTILDFNSFWFPQNYIQLGLYFKVVKHIDWKDVDPKVVLGKDYSSITGNYKIQAEVAKIPNLVPLQTGVGGAKCGA